MPSRAILLMVRQMASDLTVWLAAVDAKDFVRAKKLLPRLVRTMHRVIELAEIDIKGEPDK